MICVGLNSNSPCVLVADSASFQLKVERLDRSVRARIDEASSFSAVSASGADAPALVAQHAALLLLDDACLSEQPSAGELTFFREAALDFNVPLSDLADSVTAVISTVVKLRAGIPDQHELKLMRSHLNTVTIELQLLAKHLESLEDCVAQLGADHWVKREAGNIADAMKALGEKVGLFRLYLKDVAGPSGAAHRHKLLFASQYLVETAVQLLRALDVAVLETIIQMSVRTALVAQRIYSIAFRPKHSGTTSDSASGGDREKHTPLKSLVPLLTDCLVTLTNAVWKRGLQLPDAHLRQQLDETCGNIGACARLFIDVCAERRKIAMQRQRSSASSASSDRLRERVTVAAASRQHSGSKAADASPASPAPGGNALPKRAVEALDMLQLQLAHMCALLATSNDSPAPGASLAAEIDSARKQLFRVIDTHLQSSSAVRPDGKAELSGNAVLRLAMLLKRLVVDFESLKLVPGSLASSAAASSSSGGVQAQSDDRPVTRVTSIQSLSKLVRELTQLASSLLEHMPPSPALQQVRVFIVVSRRFLLRLQLACSAQVAGSPIQVHVPLPLLLRGITATLSLLIRGLDDIGALRAEREALRIARSKATLRHRRRSRVSSEVDGAPQLSSSPPPTSSPTQPQSQAQSQPQQQQQQQQQTQPGSGPPSLSGSLRRTESPSENESSPASSQRSSSLRNRESPNSSRPNSRPGSLRSDAGDRQSVELSPSQLVPSVSPTRPSGKRKSMPAGGRLVDL
jgi:hypothetical protein